MSLDEKPKLGECIACACILWSLLNFFPPLFTLTTLPTNNITTTQYFSHTHHCMLSTAHHFDSLTLNELNEKNGTKTTTEKTKQKTHSTVKLQNMKRKPHFVCGCRCVRYFIKFCNKCALAPFHRLLFPFCVHVKCFHIEPNKGRHWIIIINEVQWCFHARHSYTLHAVHYITRYKIREILILCDMVENKNSMIMVLVCFFPYLHMHKCMYLEKFLFLKKKKKKRSKNTVNYRSTYTHAPRLNILYFINILKYVREVLEYILT